MSLMRPTSWTGQVEAPEAGERVDAWVARRLGVSRNEARRLVERGQVYCSGRAARKGQRLTADMAVEVAGFVPPDQRTPIAEPDLGVPVAAEGPGWCVVDKPAGMAVHPLESQERGTVLNWAASRWPELARVGEGGLRGGVVHRLDLETSGCLLLATDQPTWRRLREAFRRHETVKRYRAVVAGRLQGAGRDVLHLIVARHRPARVRVVDADVPGARRCDHAWRSLACDHDRSLIEIELGTGFLHQIRVALAHRGHPVLGDALYGDGRSAPRLMLHATHLRAGPAEADARPPRVPGFAWDLAG